MVNDLPWKMRKKEVIGESQTPRDGQASVSHSWQQRQGLKDIYTDS